MLKFIAQKKQNKTFSNEKYHLKLSRVKDCIKKMYAMNNWWKMIL